MSMNLDDLRKLREEAMASGPGTGRWIKCAQALMDAFPAYYETAKAMNKRHVETSETLARLTAVVTVAQDWAIDRNANELKEAALMNALRTFNGDQAPGAGGEGDCATSCKLCTVAQANTADLAAQKEMT